MNRTRSARMVLVVVAVCAFVLAGQRPGAAAGFNTGDAQATADTFALNVKAANATIGFTYGRSIAQYQDRTGSAEGRALDLGALPTLFGGEQCDGSAPLINPATVPPLTRADSTDAGSDRSRRTQAFLPGLNGGPPGDPVGFQDATATPLPASRAVTESVPADVFLVAVDGGRTEVTSRLEGQVREARAVSTADQLRVFGGLFTFDAPRWEATARSGERTTAEGSFTFERATVLGIPRSAPDALADLAGFKAGLEELLAPLGVRLELPQVQVRDDGVRVTPMAFRIVDPPFGTQVLVPFLGQVDPLVQALRQQAVRDDCKNETVLTVLDILLGVLGGSGAVEVLAGGVDAATHDVDYSVPPPEPAGDAPSDQAGSPPVAFAPDALAFDDLGQFDPSMTDLGATPLDEGTFTDLGLDATTGAAPDAAVAGAGTGRATDQVLPSAALSRFEDGAAGRAAVVVGVTALLAALGLSTGDRFVGRRTRRRIP